MKVELIKFFNGLICDRRKVIRDDFRFFKNLNYEIKDGVVY